MKAFEPPADRRGRVRRNMTDENSRTPDGLRGTKALFGTYTRPTRIHSHDGPSLAQRRRQPDIYVQICSRCDKKLSVHNRSGMCKECGSRARGADHQRQHRNKLSSILAAYELAELGNALDLKLRRLIVSETMEVKQTAWPEWLEAVRKEYSGLSEHKLLNEFKALITATVENVRRQAVLVRLLEEGGADLSDITSPWLDDLRRVAYGQLVPELIVLATRNRAVFWQAKKLPVPDQTKLAKDEPLPVVVHREGYGPEPRMVKPSRMQDWEIRQVIGSGHIRSEAEQVSYLDNPRNRRASRVAEPIVVDMKNRQIIVSGDRIILTASQLLDYAKRLTEKK